MLRTWPQPQSAREGSGLGTVQPFAAWLCSIRQAALAALSLSFLVYATGIRASLRTLIKMKQDDAYTTLRMVPGPDWILETCWLKQNNKK